jgi:hypothetical protein
MKETEYFDMTHHSCYSITYIYLLYILMETVVYNTQSGMKQATCFGT